MSDLLDVDLRDFGTAYHAWVDRSEEFEAIIGQWYVQAHGVEPSLNDRHHAYWRVMVERDRWGTLRAALQETWPLGDFSNGPAPVAPPEAPQPAPAPHLPDRPSPGSGGFRLEKLVRVTGPQDGEFVNRSYSYWNQSVILGDAAYVFAGNVDEHIYFFQVSERGHVVRLGSLLPYKGTGEGWSWDRHGWVYLLEGPRLRRVNPFSGQDIVIFDISEAYPGCDLFQPHSSESGQTHSATVRRIVQDGPYEKIATVVFRNGKLEPFPARGVLDESSLAGDEWLIIKEDDDNRIINLVTRETRIIHDRERALGHSDNGPDYAVGEADKPDPGACVIWHLRDLNRGPRILFHTLNMGYVSVRNGVCLLSDATHLGLVSLEGGSVVMFHQHDGGSDYDSRVKANLSPCARVAAYVSGGALYLVPVPR